MRQFYGFKKGINLGGWLSQNILTTEHLDTFIQEHDIAYISNMGADHVRLPIDFELIEDADGNDLESGYTYIDNAIAWCLKYNLNIILDLHKTAGYVFDDQHYSSDFFSNQPMMDRFVYLWERLTARYGNNPDHIAFDLLNEVVDASVSEAWNALAQRTIQSIRKTSQNVWIVLGGTRSNSVVTLKDLGKPYDERIAYNFHCYEPLLFTHQRAHWVEHMPKDFQIDYPKPIEDYVNETNALIDPTFSFPIQHLTSIRDGKEFFRAFFKEAYDIAKLYDVPLYCGEYGVIDCVEPAATLRWFEDIHSVFEEYGVGRAVWTYKEKDFGLIGDHYQSIWEDLMKCL